MLHLMSQTLSSFIFNRILNQECEVIPPGRSNTEMSEKVIYSTILPSTRKWLQKTLYRKVLPILTGP